MATDRHKMRILIFCIGIITISAESQSTTEDRQNEGNGEARALFSPRVDYNEWMPVGRGDPLKNDPTYDYSPPVLDRVQYWGNSNKSKDKKEILLLGVTSKRSHKNKEPKFNSIMRRNFFSHPPTRLMPPPMQTISPTAKHPSTENYRNSYYHHNNYQIPSQQQQQQQQQQQGWSRNKIKYGDSNVEESINYASVSRPNKNSIRNEYPSHHSQPPRKPWLHALLEKEVTKPTPSYVMQPSKSIFESHPPASFESSPFYPTTSTTFAPTTSTSTPIYMTTTEASYFQPTVPPTPTTTDTPFSPYNHLQQSLAPFNQPNSIYNQPQQQNSPFNQPPSKLVSYNEPELPAARPMYLIIEGHSKVKTYGQKDNSSVKDHLPKIVPIQPKDETVIKHVVSKDEKGDTREVMHLHKKHEDIPTSTYAPTAMGDLLSLLDSSLGGFFLADAANAANDKNNNKTEEKVLEHEESKIPELETKAEKSIKADKSEKVRKLEIMKNLEIIDDKIDRESRQVFDYDNLPEASLRDKVEAAGIEKELEIMIHPKHANITFSESSESTV